MSKCQDCLPTSTNVASFDAQSNPDQTAAAPSREPFSSSFSPALDVPTILPSQVEALQRQELAAVVIEFCDRCRWLHRASWVQTELLLTFAQASSSASPTKPSAASRGAVLHSSTLIPLTAEDTGGRFRVWLVENGKAHLISDRKSESGFPEVKVLKQRIRDIIAPTHSLGHSDGHKRTDEA